jgi:hypothetical protein
MAVATEDATLFRNEEWTVTQGGLEHEVTGYFIARDEIGSRRTDGLWSWPLHMAEKSWCSVPAFMEAFSCAVAAYGVAADADLAQSFQVARREIATGLAPRPLSTGDEAGRTLHSDAAAPIFWKPASVGRPVVNSGRSSAPFQERSRPRDSASAAIFPPTARARMAHPDFVRATRWRASHRIRIAGTRIARLLRAALSTG